MASSEIIPGQPVTSFRGEGIDSQRACRILGVNYRTLMRLAASGCIEWFEDGKRSWKRVRYNSIVDLCDRLRNDYDIADRRPILPPPHLRHRDEDLLPFPLQDTMSAPEVLRVLGFAKTPSLVGLIEKGCFEAYQVVPESPWRVSRSSLTAWWERIIHPAPLPSDDPIRYKVGSMSTHF